MDMTFKSILLAGLAIVLLGSCEKTLFIDVSETEPRIVMNGILTQNSGLWLNVSESTGTSTPAIKSFIPTENATVQILKNDQLLTTITENSSGNYHSMEFNPLVDQAYEIRVNAEGMPDATTIVSIPDRVEISDFDTSTVVLNQNNYNQIVYKEVNFFLNFSISDPGDRWNYYTLGVYYLENNTYYPLQVDTEDLVMNIYIKDGVEVLAWDDNTFNGEKRSFNVRFGGQNHEGFETVILVQLYSIQEDYFDYLKTYSQNYTVLNETGLLYEPVEVSTNITGGFGIVAAVATSSITFNYTF